MRAAIAWETVELRCGCGEAAVCLARGPLDLAEFLRGAVDLGWRRIDPDRIEVSVYGGREVEIRLSGICGECAARLRASI